MKLVYTNANPLCVENAKNIVEQAGIQTLLKNEFIHSGAAELVSISAWLELWVANDSDYDAAKMMLQVLEVEAQGEPWKCGGCGESNEATFDSCWNCQKEKLSP